MYVCLSLSALTLRCLCGSWRLSFLDEDRFHLFAIILCRVYCHWSNRVLGQLLLLFSWSLLCLVWSNTVLITFFILYPRLFYHLILIRVLILTGLSSHSLSHEQTDSFLLFGLSFFVFARWDRLVLLLYIVMVAIVAYLWKYTKSTCVWCRITELLTDCSTFKQLLIDSDWAEKLISIYQFFLQWLLSIWKVLQ